MSEDASHFCVEEAVGQGHCEPLIAHLGDDDEEEDDDADDEEEEEEEEEESSMGDWMVKADDGEGKRQYHVTVYS